MLRARIFLCLFPLLMACQQASRVPAGAESRSDHSVAEVASLAGTWKVTSIDEKALDERSGLSLTADEAKLWWEPGCAGIVRKYDIAGQAISFGPLNPPAPAGSPPAPVCAIGLPPRLDEVVRALDAATAVSRAAENQALISGGGHSLGLVRHERPNHPQ